MRDDLGTRMKEQYENRTRIMLPRRTYTLIRVDGKAFHTYTKDCARPFDVDLAWAMGRAAQALCCEAQGCCFGYTQSDEISIVLQDFATPQTDAWFNGNLQKICSVSASTVTKAFNAAFEYDHQAMFDARVWTIPDPVEVENYFIWRQQDASRNSLSMLCQSVFSHTELDGKNRTQQHEMLHARGINWNDCEVWQKRGIGVIDYPGNGWGTDYNIPVWTEDRSWLTSRIPRIWEEKR